MAQQEGTMMKSILLIGDSIRMGYQATVRDLLANRADVWAPKQNGGTSRNVLDHLDEWVISRSPDVVHINCGLHDLKKEFGQDEAAVPLEEYEQNVKQILDRLRAETNATVLFALTTPVNEKRHHDNKPFDRFQADVVEYHRAATRTASGFDVPVNDLFGVVEQAGRDNVLLPDGVHFTADGYRLLGKAVADLLSERVL